MPVNAARDNETLDHLLSVVNDTRNVSPSDRFWKGSNLTAGHEFRRSGPTTRMR